MNILNKENKHLSVAHQRNNFEATEFIVYNVYKVYNSSLKSKSNVGHFKSTLLIFIHFISNNVSAT